MVHRVQVYPISNDEGDKLLRIVRRSIGSVVTCEGLRWFCCRVKAWACRRSQVAFISTVRVRDVLHNFHADGFDSLRRSTPRPASEVRSRPADTDQDDRVEPAQ
jgi:hypothetical protein